MEPESEFTFRIQQTEQRFSIYVPQLRIGLEIRGPFVQTHYKKNNHRVVMNERSHSTSIQQPESTPKPLQSQQWLVIVYLAKRKISKHTMKPNWLQTMQGEEH
jgi:hypothetical protein